MNCMKYDEDVAVVEKKNVLTRRRLRNGIMIR